MLKTVTITRGQLFEALLGWEEQSRAISTPESQNYWLSQSAEDAAGHSTKRVWDALDFIQRTSPKPAAVEA